MQTQPKVLFISSWYPNLLRPTEGNFVDQHIKTAQQIAQVALVHVVLSSSHKTLTHELKQTPFETHLIYLPKNNLPFLGVLINYFQVLFTYWKFASNTKIGKPDLIHANVLYPIGLVGILLKWRWRIPLVFSEHWTCYHPYADPQPPLLVKSALRWIAKRADLILPVSLDLAVAMQQFGIRVPMKVVPNVVDPAVFKIKEKRAHRVYRFVHVSSLDAKQKNFHLLVRAFYALKKEQENVELHVVSDGNEKAYAQLLKDFDFASSIHFHGKQDPEGVAAILQFADAFVLSSRYENLPCVLIESLACGTPVISTQVGGVAEIVHSQNGLLVPSEDLTALINAMKQIQGMSFEGVDLQREMLLKFGPETISGLFLEAYQMLLKTDVA